MQNFTIIADSETLLDSRQLLLNNDQTTLSQNSGTSFPTENLLIGMSCHRADLNSVWTLKDLTPTWVRTGDLNSILVTDASNLPYDKTGTSLSSNYVQGAITELENNKAEVSYVDAQITNISSNGIPKLNSYKYSVMTTTDGQTVYEIPFDSFDSNTDTLIVFRNSTYLTIDNYVITNAVYDSNGIISTRGYITLTTNDTVSGQTEISYLILKNTPIGVEGAVNGRCLALGSVPFDRVIGVAPDGYGLGTSATLITDAHSIKVGGQYRCIGTSTANCPTVDTDYYMIDANGGWGEGQLSLKATSLSSGVTYICKAQNSTWSSWKQIVTTDSPVFSGNVAITPGTNKIGFQYSTGNTALMNYVTANGASSMDFYSIWGGAATREAFTFNTDIGGKAVAITNSGSVSIKNLYTEAVGSEGLLVQAGANTTASYILKLKDYTGNVKAIVDGTGKFGIGTPSPDDLLHVKSDTASSATILQKLAKFTSSDGYGLEIGTYGNSIEGNKYAFIQPIGSATVNNLVLGYTSPLHVGVGCTPQATLHTAGSTILGGNGNGITYNMIGSSQFLISINEAANTLDFYVKYSDGTTHRKGYINLVAD